MLHYTESGCREESTLESYSMEYEWFPVKSFYQVSELDLTLPFLGASLGAQTVKNLPAMLETWVRSLGWEDSLEEEMATHSSILAWRNPWTKEPGGPQSIGLQRLGYDWNDSATAVSEQINYVKYKIVVGHKKEVKVAQSCPTLCDPMEFSRPEYWSG